MALNLVTCSLRQQKKRRRKRRQRVSRSRQSKSIKNADAKDVMAFDVFLMAPCEKEAEGMPLGSVPGSAQACDISEKAIEKGVARGSEVVAKTASVAPERPDQKNPETALDAAEAFF